MDCLDSWGALHWWSMRRILALSIPILMVVPCLTFGQGIRMSPDFIPLEAGNVWQYEILDAEGQTLDSFDVEISAHMIVEGVSVYLFTQFPFAPDITVGGQIGIRYDRNRRQYVRFDGEVEDDLFPSLGVSGEVLESDADGLPLRARFDFGTLTLTLERSVGVVEAEFPSAQGPRFAKLVGAVIGNARILGEVEVPTPQPAAPVGGTADNVGPVSADSLSLQVEAIPEDGGHRLLFGVRNTSDTLLAFDFNSSQSFDFIVIDPGHGQEIWRWSERMLFSDVVRSEGIQAGGEWSFEAVWNHRDRQFKEVEPGVYEVVAILTSELPLEAEPIEIEVQ